MARSNRSNRPKSPQPEEGSRLESKVPITLGSAPTPERVYPCQKFRLDSMPGGLHLLTFSQSDPLGRILSLIIVQFCDGSLQQLRATFKPGFRASLIEFANKASGPSDLSLSDADVKAVTIDRIYSVAANVARVTVSNFGSAIDCFMLDLHGLRVRQLARGTGPAESKPVVGISMCNLLLCHFVSQLDAALGPPVQTDESMDEAQGG